MGNEGINSLQRERELIEAARCQESGPEADDSNGASPASVHGKRPLPPGIGDYTIIREIGHGSFGSVTG